MTNTKIINFTGFQVVWLTSVGGAASGYPWIGPVAVLLWSVIHFYIHKQSIHIELPLIFIAASIGYMLDSILVLLGIMQFPVQAQLAYPSTLWMVALWINLAITIRHCLDWLNNRYMLICFFGGLGGALAYWAGVRLGALIMSDITIGMISVFSVWFFALPLLFFISNRLTERKQVSSLQESHNNV